MSMKEEAFALFNQGKRPKDPEVKALGLTAKTSYNYYQEWKKKKVTGLTLDQDELSMLKKERERLSVIADIEKIKDKRAKLPNRLDAVEERLGTLQSNVDALIECIENMCEVIDNTTSLAIYNSYMATDPWITSSQINVRSQNNKEADRLSHETLKILGKLGVTSDMIRKYKSNR